MQHDRQFIWREQVPWPCVFSKNNHNEDFIRRNTHQPTTTTEAYNNATPTTTATIPYIKGISKNISRILQPFNIRVAHKPITTQRQLLTNVKDQDDKPHYWLGLCAVPNLQHQLLQTIDSGKLVY